MTRPGFLRAGCFVSSLRLRRAQPASQVAHIIRAAAGKDAGKRNDSHAALKLTPSAAGTPPRR